MPTSTHLLATITRKADSIFKENHGDVTKDNHAIYVENWFEVAAKFREEVANEGLVKTVKEIDKIVEEQRKFCA